MKHLTCLIVWLQFLWAFLLECAVLIEYYRFFYGGGINKQYPLEIYGFSNNIEYGKELVRTIIVITIIFGFSLYALYNRKNKNALWIAAFVFFAPVIYGWLLPWIKI